ncbi:hypothetical protein KIH39_10020 [Telmatocola sphagniphila]|uniref:Uncharacterized protein n=1 Tax=Telmatocola sphagniphila TaxID=1123043 RepID=A0A8E6EUX7_9BACT|nr:DUF669 domain-containing protein [Telmatocola sphagniphila]QVL34219.1 hypothetical protein KIH39_10020 [Telmatocola sphagniphila]
MEPRKRLSDILAESASRKSFSELWKNTKPARDFVVIPAGEYLCRVRSGELGVTKEKGTRFYKLGFEIVEGEFARRRVWHDSWLTPDALPYTKRDLEKIGIYTEEQLEEPLPTGILVKLRLVVRRDEDGKERNRIKSFEYFGREEADPFSPEDLTGGDSK